MDEATREMKRRSERRRERKQYVKVKGEPSSSSLSRFIMDEMA